MDHLSVTCQARVYRFTRFKDFVHSVQPPLDSMRITEAHQPEAMRNKIVLTNTADS